MVGLYDAGSELLRDAARLTVRDLVSLARPGFAVRIIDTLEEFYLAEALEYITPGGKRHPITRSVFADLSARRSSCHSLPGS